jgi:hypothetical protein
MHFLPAKCNKGSLEINVGLARRDSQVPVFLEGMGMRRGGGIGDLHNETDADGAGGGGRWPPKTGTFENVTSLQPFNCG